MQDHIFVEATFQIISKAKGQMLFPRRTIMVKHSMDGIPLSSMDMNAARAFFFADVEASVRVAASSYFINQLKTDTFLKRQVGGIKWVVDLVGSVEEFPLYLREEPIGSYSKYINLKRPFMPQIVHRNLAILQELCEPIEQEKKAA